MCKSSVSGGGGDGRRRERVQTDIGNKRKSRREALCSVLLHTATRGGRPQLQLLRITRSVVLCRTASFVHSTCRQNLLCLNDEIRAPCPCSWTQTGTCRCFPPLKAQPEPNRSVQSRPLLVTHPNTSMLPLKKKKNTFFLNYLTINKISIRKKRDTLSIN